MEKLSEQEKLRYQRQMLLKGWGEEGQLKLKKSTVFVAGCGGGGNTALYQLVQTGIGKIIIADGDVVEEHNLNRQFLQDETRIGLNKAKSAKMTLEKLNPYVEIEAIPEFVKIRNTDKLIGDSDIIIHCADSDDAAIALNDYIIRKKKPMAVGMGWNMGGILTFLHPPKTGCMYCTSIQVYGNPKDYESDETTANFSSPPAAMASLAVIEAIKYLLGVGDLLANKFMIFRGGLNELQFAPPGEKYVEEFDVEKSPKCPACGKMRHVVSKLLKMKDLKPFSWIFNKVRK